MVNTNSTSIKQGDNNDPIFKPFTWHHEVANQATIDGKAYAELAGTVRDVSQGVQTILELIEFDYLRGTSGERPVMSDIHAGDLSRLAIRSLMLLSEDAERRIEWAYENQTAKDRVKEASHV